MPIYEYICTQCGHKFEKIVFGRQKVTCPACQARQVTRIPSVFGIGGTPPAGLQWGRTFLAGTVLCRAGSREPACR